MPPVSFILFIAVVMVELALTLGWNPVYFRSGIPIFTRRIPLKGHDAALPTPDALTEQLYSRWGHSLVFKTLSDREIAFREKALEFSFFNSTPVMHGLIRCLPEERSVVVIGWMNWTLLGFAVMFFYITFDLGMGYGVDMLLFPVIFFIIIGLCFYVQARRYNRVGAALTEFYAAAPDKSA